MRDLKKNNTLENKRRYRQVKCNYNWELKKARIVYYKRCIGENKNKEKPLNRMINKLTGKNVKQVLPKHGSEGDIARKICNFLNEKIVNIRNKIRKSTPSNISTLSSFHETSETELQNIIMNMNSKSCALDPIPTWLVKSSFNELKMAMLYNVNRSLVIENTFPETLKHAIVTPSLKDRDGDSEDYYNYRPISNTAFPSKMLEKIALSQINCHIEKYNNQGTVKNTFGITGGI